MRLCMKKLCFLEIYYTHLAMCGQGLVAAISKGHISLFLTKSTEYLISISWPTLHFGLHFGLGSWIHPRDRRDIPITILQDNRLREGVKKNIESVIMIIPPRTPPPLF